MEKRESIDLYDIKIEQVDLSKRLKMFLKKAGIETLGDLLNTDYQRICMFRGIGEQSLIELKNYVHSLDFQLLNETPFLGEILLHKKAKGERLLKDLGFSPKLCNSLYKFNIYTAEDLTKYGYQLTGREILPKQLRDELDAKIAEIGIIIQSSESLEDQIRIDTLSMMDEIADKNDVASLTQTQRENTLIRDRISRKEEHLKKIQALMDERRSLLDYERTLDLKIAQLMKEFESKADDRNVRS